MAGSVTVAVRTLHVLGMAVLLGGAAALWYRCSERDGIPRSDARRYERAFWGVVGVMVVTGVGNLGALGAPGPDTRWGTIFLGKLLLVVAFVLGSVVRTLVVARADVPVRTAEDGRAPVAPFRRAYAATTVVLVALVVLAEVLAHG